jgi:hypothetical protein
MGRKRLYGTTAERVAAWRAGRKGAASVKVAVEPNPYRAEVEMLRARVAELEAQLREREAAPRPLIGPNTSAIASLAGDRCPGCGGLWSLIGRTHRCGGRGIVGREA